ncbi:MAG: hypothetical protein ACLGG0_11940 [Bacteriovoracia bacterium]
MKFVLIASLLLTFSAWGNSLEVELCRDRALIEYEIDGQRSDIPYRMSEGEISVYNQQTVFTYEVSGSYHSGWFTDLLIVEPYNCSLITSYNIYSE